MAAVSLQMTGFDNQSSKLTTEDWQLIKKLFIQLTELSSDEVTEQLDQLCQDTPHIKPTLAKMLGVFQSSTGETITPKLSAANVIANQAILESGDSFGKYQIIKLIGAGGMGHVYLAQRNDEIHQQVAIKILNQHLMDEQSQLRFDIERRVLASLEHPNIARLIDAGSEYNNAYYVMEYVDGIAIDQYCSKNRLGLNQRLKLFLKICDAVSLAHSHLIVHRDLKPSNILVNEQGEVKLLDFGIAKPLKILPGTEAIHETLVGTTALTPQYAAPEQINGDAISVGCDIYVLGLLLYQLLTDQPAFNLSNKTWGEIEHAINHQLPNLPSKQVLKNAANTDQTSELKQTNNHSWAKKLKGDLDAIVSHALKKEPVARYSSVQEMAADIKHHLNHEPLQIKHSQAAYRIKKHLRKHWLPISALSVIFTVMLVSTLLIWQQSATIKLERDKALTEKQVAEEVTDFLVDTFKSADPTQTLGTKLTAGDILQQGVKQIEQQDQNPNTKNRLLSTLAEVYMNLSAYDQAQLLVEQVVVDDLSNQDSQVKLMYIKAKIMAEKGKTKEALDLIDGIEFDSSVHDNMYFSMMNLKANLLKGTDQFDVATALAESLVEKAEVKYGDNSYIYAIQLREYAKSISSSSTTKQVINLFQQSLAVLENIKQGSVQLELLETKRKLMVELIRDLQYEEALAMSFDLENAYSQIFPPDHVMLARIYNSRGRIFSNTNRPKESIISYTKSKEIYTKATGENSNNVAFAEINIAVTNLYRLSNFELSKTYFETALQKFELNSGKTNNYFYMNLPYATCLIKLNRYDEAKVIIKESLEYYLNREIRSDRNIALAQSLLAHVLVQEGKYQEAKELLLGAFASVMQHYGDTLHKDMMENDLSILNKELGENYEF